MTAIKKCPHNSQISCSDCRLGAICLPLSLEDEDIVQLDKIVERGKPFQQNEYVYEAGDEFKSVYAVRSGCRSPGTFARWWPDLLGPSFQSRIGWLPGCGEPLRRVQGALVNDTYTSVTPRPRCAESDRCGLSP